MQLLYFDEHENNICGREYTAISGVVVSSRKSRRIRAQFFNDLDYLLHKENGARAARIIRRPPILHGSDLLREFPDDVKIQATDLLFRHHARGKAKFFRLGYFNDSIFRFARSKEARIAHCAYSLLLGLHRYFRQEFLIAHELDLRALEKGLSFTTDQIAILELSAKASNIGNISIDLKRIIGHFLAPKTDIHCQMADMAGYVCQKRDNPKSSFGKALSEIHERYSNLYLYDEIIEMKML